MAALPSLSAMAAALLFVVSPADAQVWGTQGSWSGYPRKKPAH